MCVTFVLACSLLAAQPATAAPSSIALQHCLVSLIDEAQVPAKEHGELMQLHVTEGQTLKAGDPMAQIDDADAQAALRVADFKLRQANEEAGSDVYVRYSKASADVARANYQAAEEACKRIPNTFSLTEMREKWLVWNRATLEIEKSEMDHRILGLKAKVAEAEAEVARESTERRVIRSPIDGTVVEIRRHVGEWVQPGDPIIHVMRYERLRVEGFIQSQLVDPAEVDGKPVSVTIELARGRKETLPGKVTYVNQSDQAGRVYRVWAEIENRQEGGHWLVRPGLEAEMTIQLRQAEMAAPR
jgi:multidrug resistance efflux pump